MKTVIGMEQLVRHMQENVKPLQIYLVCILAQEEINQFHSWKSITRQQLQISKGIFQTGGHNNG